MIGITKSALVGALTTAVLVPGTAHAGPTADVSAVVKATVRAEANLERAQELAGSTRTFAQQRAKELHQRSRAQLNAAAAKTHALVERARQTGESAAAVDATARLTAALDADAQGQVGLSAVANGRLESASMKALVADARMELRANVDLAKLAEAAKNEADVVEALATQIAGQASDVANDLQAAASGELSATAQKSADLAVAVDTKANAVYTDVLSRLHRTVENDVKPAVRQIAEAVADQATKVQREVEASTAAPHTVAVSGSADVTLVGLAIVSGEASVRGAVELAGTSGSAHGEARSGLRLPGLPG